MGRISRSIDIVKASWGVLRQDKELVWLPVFSMLATGVAAALFLGGFLVLSDQDPITQELRFDVAGYVLAGVAYFVLAFITIFFNAALISAANERMEGGEPHLESALAGATGRLPRIAAWALVSATVSVIIKSIQERAGILGRVLGSIAGIAWALVTFLVLPIMVVENVGVREAVSRSATLFKKTWGEQVVGNFAIGLLGFFAVLLAVPLVLVAFTVEVTAVTVALLLVAGLWVLGVSAVSTALSGVFQTALYRYATTGDAPTGFTPEQLAGAFGPKSAGPFSR